MKGLTTMLFRNLLHGLFLTLAMVVGLVSTASAQAVQDPSTMAPYNAQRLVSYSVPNVQNVPLVAVVGTGDVYSTTTLANGTWTVSLASANQPESARELIIFQSENTGSDLSVAYTVNVTLIDGTTQTYTTTIASTGNQPFPDPVLKVNSLSLAISGAAATDAIKIGYRGFYVPGAYPTAANQLLLETVNGTEVTTAGSVPQNGFWLPADSISAGDSVSVWVRTVTNLKKNYIGPYNIGEARAARVLP